MKLINADEVIRDLASLKYSNECDKVQDAYNKAIDDCVGEIKYPTSPALRIETLDEAPVKHAHVVWTESNTSHKTQCCSNCHRTCISRPDETIEFCPHCGAKMKE